MRWRWQRWQRGKIFPQLAGGVWLSQSIVCWSRNWGLAKDASSTLFNSWQNVDVGYLRKGIWVAKGVSALILRRRPQDDKHFSRSDYALEMSSLSQWKESVLRVFTMFDSCGDLVVRAISHKSSPPVREVKLGGGGAARGIENVVRSRKGWGLQ